MASQPPNTASPARFARGPWWVVASALLGAAAALCLPGPTGPAAAIAAVLAVGALALLAGHAWGLLVIVTADVLLLGHVWPTLAFSGPGALSSGATLAAATALATTLPGLTLLGVALPAMVDLVWGESSARSRSAGVATCALFMVLALVLPAL
jgi:hypothetical protein